ncbi:hypothetical protein WR25_12972 [Diploscapter pachys]|uniref:Uncharacterized protein n=1 Tax=Diploscapter pachys TaxID=2018661 RepID=A0A2A2M6G6_9BILA|nr:hypothetical protein WR25_12972 [Diploscapter pachys]
MLHAGHTSASAPSSSANRLAMRPPMDLPPMANGPATKRRTCSYTVRQDSSNTFCGLGGRLPPFIRRSAM